MATFSVGSPVGYGERTVFDSGIELEDKDHCSGCGEAFEVETDTNEDGQPEAIVVVPVENAQGNFCSKKCEADAFFDDAPAEVQKDLRKLYLASIMVNAALTQDVIEHFKKWDGLNQSMAIDGVDVAELEVTTATLTNLLDAEGSAKLYEEPAVYLLPQKDYEALRREMAEHTFKAKYLSERPWVLKNSALAAMYAQDSEKAQSAQDALKRAERIG